MLRAVGARLAPSGVRAVPRELEPGSALARAVSGGRNPCPALAVGLGQAGVLEEAAVLCSAWQGCAGQPQARWGSQQQPRARVHVWKRGGGLAVQSLGSSSPWGRITWPWAQPGRAGALP